jgi:hypothetical protein
MYGTSEVKGDAGKPMFMAGITENVELSKVAFENSKSDGTGKDVLSMTFTASNGAEFRKIFWEVDANRVIEMNQKYSKTHTRDNTKLGIKKGETVTDEQAVILAYDEFNRHIKHIMTKYMSEEDSIITNVSSYKDFAGQVIKKLSPRIAGKKMRLKLIYNKNNYLDTPRYGNYLDNMENPVSSLSINPRWDNVVRAEPTEEPVAEAFSDSPATTNDMPF